MLSESERSRIESARSYGVWFREPVDFVCGDLECGEEWVGWYEEDHGSGEISPHDSCPRCGHEEPIWHPAEPPFDG